MLNSILIPVVIIAIIGLVSGIILSVVSQLLRVKENKKVAEIAAVLPGANCGGCGFAGCEDYARAVSEGRAEGNLCAPGGGKTAALISDLTGTENETVAVRIAYVRCGGSSDEDKYKFIYNGIRSCSAAVMYFGGPGYCTYGCSGYGDCAEACLFGAITVSDGSAKVDPVKCTGCGACIKACPKGIIALTEKCGKAKVICCNEDKGGVTKKICSGGCIGCGKCMKVCDAGAIKVINNMAFIEESLCSGCGRCAVICPVKVIKL